MKTNKSITVPFIEGLESMNLESLDLEMELHGSKLAICENNWPDAAPYSPDCNAAIARSKTHLAVIYHVRGLDLRAVAMEDNGNSWEDSCCEFFVAHPDDGTYCNFELTCIGSLLASKRTSRTDSRLIEPSELSKVIRFSSLEHKPYNENGKIASWTAAMLIPFSMIGFDGLNLPKTARANFYKCGDLTAHPHFLSWNPIDTPSPDFHRPEHFGELIFQ